MIISYNTYSFHFMKEVCIIYKFAGNIVIILVLREPWFKWFEIPDF